MACSRFEYVKAFEHHPRLLPGCWAVIRLDGRSFTRFTRLHHFHKPNDRRALRLCNAAARHVLRTFDDHLVFAYGQSDEYSFVLRRQSDLFARRADKILSTVVSLFSAAYVFHWQTYMQGVHLREPPAFDGRVVLYPTTKHLRDYLGWRQADVHVNNLFNTAFWALAVGRQGSAEPVGGNEAERVLRGTTAAEKNELLFERFGINYNEEDAMFRKGTFLVKNEPRVVMSERSRKRRRVGGNEGKGAEEGAGEGAREGTWEGDLTAEQNGEEVMSEAGAEREESEYVELHVDIIGDQFWEDNVHLLGPSDLLPPRIKKSLLRRR